jgi:hypothetical protein
MKKLFPMEVPNLKPPRVVEAIKHDIRKYLKRERRKTCPEGVDFWDFDCRTGPNPDQAKPTHVADIDAAIHTASAENWPTIYIEILAKPGHRTKKAVEPKDEPVVDEE